MQYRDIDAKKNKLLNDYIYEDKHNIDEFLNKTQNYYKVALDAKQKREKEITNIYNTFIQKHKNSLKEIENLLN